MEKVKMCRICLVEEVRMHVVFNKELQDIYEKLTNIPFATASNTDRPLWACFICYARLKNCYTFTVKCLQSEEVFSQMLSEHYERKPTQIQEKFKTCGLVRIPVQHIHIIDIVEQHSVTTIFKEEVVGDDVSDAELKKERHSDGIEPEALDHSYPDLDDNQTHSDSEDDVPLTIIKNVVAQEVKKKRKKLNKRERDAEWNRLKFDSQEILLSKEEQLENLMARCKSQNYTNSPFKCDMCYKGFVDMKAYDNHRIKHDVRSGVHICEICKMRYRTPQHLRTHVGNTHARLFKCNKCGYITHTTSQARVHDKWHKGHIYECQLCSHTFRKPTSYLSHMRKTHPTEHVCDICGESFVGNHGLQMHKAKTHQNDEKKEDPNEPASERFCSECNIQFFSLEAWERHILSSIKHTLKNEHSSQCSICEWRFTGNVTLSTHMREHEKRLRQSRNIVTSDRHLRCQQCGSNFVNRSKLQAHINRTHLGLKYNKNIVCEVCGKKCTSNATLRYHQRTHTGEKPYSCSSCSKRFADSNQLRIHTRTHTGEKPYVCAVCGKRFSQKPALTRHYRVHTGAKPYTCQYCSRTFSQSNSLKLHVKTVHLKQPANSRKNKMKDTTQEIKITDTEKNGQELLQTV